MSNRNQRSEAPEHRLTPKPGATPGDALKIAEDLESSFRGGNPFRSARRIPITVNCPAGCTCRGTKAGESR